VMHLLYSLLICIVLFQIIMRIPWLMIVFSVSLLREQTEGVVECVGSDNSNMWLVRKNQWISKEYGRDWSCVFLCVM
jgi:hypothetical protein